MRVRLDQPLRCGESTIPPGEYGVDVDEDRSVVVLTQDGSVVASLAATERSAKRAVRKPKVELREVAREPRRLLVARTPPANEWVVSLDEAD